MSTVIQAAMEIDLEDAAVTRKGDASDRELVAKLVDQARAEGLELVDENGLLGRLTKLVYGSRSTPGREPSCCPATVDPLIARRVGCPGFSRLLYPGEGVQQRGHAGSDSVVTDHCRGLGPARSGTAGAGGEVGGRCRMTT